MFSRSKASPPLRRARRGLAATLALLVALALAGAPHTAQAQPMASPGSPLSLGLKGGVSQSTFLGDDVDEADYRAGFSGGIYAKYDLTPAFSIQPEVLFTMKGADVGIGDLEGSLGAGEYELQYLEVPVLLKLNAPLRGVVRPSLYAGPQLGFNLGGDLDDEEIDDEALTTTEFAGVLGGEIGFDVRRFGLGPLDRIVLDGRYVFGFTDTFDVVGDPSIRNGTFIGFLGLEFGL